MNDTRLYRFTRATRLTCMSLLLSIPFFVLSPISAQDKYEALGIGKTLEEARSNALNGLAQQIQVIVASDFGRVQIDTGKVMTDSTRVTTIARSFVGLSNVEEYVEPRADGSFAVIKSVNRASVEVMFAARKNRILEHVRLAESELYDADSTLGVNIGAVLKHCYWAILLSRTYPGPIAYEFRGEGGKKRASENLATALPSEMERVMKKVRITPATRVHDPFIVWKCEATYQDRDVSELVFEYVDGSGMTYSEVRNGELQLILYYSSEDKRERRIDVNLWYRYDDEMDESVAMVEELLGEVNIPNTIPVVLPAATAPTALPVTEANVTPQPEVVLAPMPVETESPRSEVTKAPEPEKNALAELPRGLQELYQNRSGFENVRTSLERLVRSGRVIIGTEKDFESLEGMYAIAVDKTGITHFLVMQGETLVDAVTKEKIKRTDLLGKRITWMEVR